MWDRNIISSVYTIPNSIIVRNNWVWNHQKYVSYINENTIKNCVFLVQNIKKILTFFSFLYLCFSCIITILSYLGVSLNQIQYFDFLIESVNVIQPGTHQHPTPLVLSVQQLSVRIIIERGVLLEIILVQMLNMNNSNGTQIGHIPIWRVSIPFINLQILTNQKLHKILDILYFLLGLLTYIFYHRNFILNMFRNYFFQIDCHFL